MENNRDIYEEVYRYLPKFTDDLLEELRRNTKGLKNKLLYIRFVNERKEKRHVGEAMVTFAKTSTSNKQEVRLSVNKGICGSCASRVVRFGNLIAEKLGTGDDLWDHNEAEEEVEDYFQEHDDLCITCNVRSRKFQNKI